MVNRWLPLILLTTLGSAALACNIPVFRYALERWQPDRCDVLVFHSAPLGRSDIRELQAVLPDRLEGIPEQSVAKPLQSLGKVSFIDVASVDAEHKAVWDRLSKNRLPSLPHVVVRGDVGSVKRFSLWQGSLTEFRQSRIFQSPARTEISRRLLAGDSVVWVLVTGRDQEKTAKARQLLRQELPRLSKQIQLPEGIGLPGSELYSDVPLLVKFSQVELKHDDPQESFLVNLFSSIRSIEVAAGEPLVIPVFGRGRALEVIPGSELNAQLMTDLTLFLSGACSCQVKEQNPGFDLLTDRDWNQELFPGGDQPPPSRSIAPGDRRGQKSKPQLLDIPSGR